MSKDKAFKPLKPFSVYVGAKSFVTNACSKNQRRLSDFASYSLSVDETKACCTTTAVYRSMRHPDPGELKILHNPKDLSSREHYLVKRLDQSPREKYYFPEATSWRHGWIQSHKGQ